MRGKLYNSFKILTILLVALSLISVVSADVLFSQTDSTYNLNDQIALNVIVKAVSPMSGFFELNMNCGGEARNFYKEYISLDVNEEREIKTSVPLNNQFVAKAGLCNIEAVINSEVLKSQSFNVSNEINVVFSSERANVEPSESLILSGTAVKKNGGKVEGFVNVYIENTELNVTGSVKNGEFSIEVKMPSNLKAGTYALKAFIYEKINSEVSNRGNSDVIINMLSVPRRLDIALSSSEIDPGNEVTYKPMIYDQAEDEIEEEDVVVKIRDSEGNLMGERIIKSGAEDKIAIEDKASPGNWEIHTSAFELVNVKAFTVNKVEKAEFAIENNTLVVINKGNVPYTKPVQVDIGGELKVVEVDKISVGSSKKFKLYAPDGVYNVKVSDGVNEASGEVALTGSAIKVKDAALDMSFGRYLLIWLFLFAILGFFIYTTTGKVWQRKKTYDVKENAMEKTEKKPADIKALGENTGTGPGVKKLSEIISPKLASPDYAEHTIALHGEKQEACLLALNVKNVEKIEMFKDLLNNVKDKILEKRGTIYQNDNFLFGIFAPLVTKSFKNEMTVVKLANELKGKLDEHNQKFKEKIDFGLAVHSGKLILEKTSEKLKFTSSDNTLALAKKLSEMAKNELLMSESTYKNSSNELRAMKEEREKIPVYHLQRVVEKADHSKFIHDFLQKNKEFFNK